jgi:hypothetical protein
MKGLVIALVAIGLCLSAPVAIAYKPPLCDDCPPDVATLMTFDPNEIVESCYLEEGPLLPVLA